MEAGDGPKRRPRDKRKKTEMNKDRRALARLGPMDHKVPQGKAPDSPVYLAFGAGDPRATEAAISRLRRKKKQRQAIGRGGQFG